MLGQAQHELTADLSGKASTVVPDGAASVSSASRTTVASRLDDASSLAVVVMLLLGFVIRLSAARNLSSHVDEAASILAARMTAEKGLPILPSGAAYLQGMTISYLLTPLAWFGFANPVNLT